MTRGSLSAGSCVITTGAIATGWAEQAAAARLYALPQDHYWSATGAEGREVCLGVCLSLFVPLLLSLTLHVRLQTR